MTEPGVIVIGAGPAGAACALLLAQRGVRTLLVERDRWPRDKVCGGCLNAAALAALRQMGFEQDAAENMSVFGHHALSQCALDVTGRRFQVPVDGSRVIDRRAFDAALVAAAQRAGACFRSATSARIVSADDRGADVVLTSTSSARGTERLRCRLAIIAGGLGTRALPPSIAPAPRVRPASRMGCGARLPAHALSDLHDSMLRMMFAEWGYIGCVRLPDGSIDAAAAMDPAAVRAFGGPGACAARITEQAAGNRLPDHIRHELEDATWRGTPALSVRRCCVAGAGWCTVGDASGYSEPFTGEGIGWALDSALRLAQIVDEAIWSPAHAERWQRHERTLHRARRTSRMLCRSLRSPKIFANMLRAGETLPWLQRQVLARIGRAGKSGMTSTAAIVSSHPVTPGTPVAAPAAPARPTMPARARANSPAPAHAGDSA